MTENVNRNYYVPKNAFGRQIINRIIDKIGGSIEKISFVRDTEGKELINVSYSCNKRDLPSVEKILKFYDIL